VDNFGYVATMNTRTRAGIASGILLLVSDLDAKVASWKKSSGAP
jgi:hypothetical protein